MAKADQSGGAPFDLDKLRELIELMEKHGLSEINLKRGEERWQLRRGGGETIQMVPAPVQAPVAAPVATPAAAPAPAASAPVAASEDEGLIDITSPTVGTFYSSPSPDDPAFVTVGAKVEPDTVVCLVEAMKVFNQIPAEVSGTIAKILVKDGEAVEFGQALFKVKAG